MSGLQNIMSGLTVLLVILARPIRASWSSTTTTPVDDKVKLLIFETDENSAASHLLAAHAHDLLGLDATVFGQGSVFNGFSSKYATVRPLLKALDDDTVVILSDGRDVIVNTHADASTSAGAAIRSNFDALVKDASDGAVVISAEAQCCVAALTYFTPGDLFDEETGERTERACPSGQPGCMWPEGGDEKRKPWMGFMSSLAELKTGAKQTDKYLNAGLIAGKPKDLLRFFAALKLDETEDDQAVMTDYLFHHPNAIVLDYGQALFGANRWPQGMDNGGCIFDYDATAQAMVHSETGTTPPFVHSPGKFFECNDKLAEQLGQHHVEHDTKKRRLSDSNYNYVVTLAPTPAVQPTAAPTTAPPTAPPQQQTTAGLSLEVKAGITAAAVLVFGLAASALVLRVCRNARRDEGKGTVGKSTGGTTGKKAVEMIDPVVTVVHDKTQLRVLSEGDAVSSSSDDEEGGDIENPMFAARRTAWTKTKKKSSKGTLSLAGAAA